MTDFSYGKKNEISKDLTKEINTNTINLTYNTCYQPDNQKAQKRVSQGQNPGINFRGKSFIESDFNSLFYMRMTDAFIYLKKRKFDFNEFEFFYSEVICNFIVRMISKRIACKQKNEFFDILSSFNKIMLNSLKELRKEKIQLSKLKNFLVSILYNNNEISLLVNKMNYYFAKNDHNLEDLYEKLMMYNKIGFNFTYGKCCNNDTINRISNIKDINLNTSNVFDSSFYSNPYNSGNKNPKPEKLLSKIMPYVSSGQHTHTFIYDSIIKENTGDNLCLACAWDLYILCKIKDERICLKELETILDANKNATVIISNKKTKLHTVDFYYYIKFICFLQPLCFSLRNTIDSHNASQLSVSKSNLGVKDYSELLEKKKEKIFLKTKKEYVTLVFEYVFCDDDFNEFEEVINFDHKMRNNNDYKKNENSMIFLSDHDSRGGRDSKQILNRFSNTTENEKDSELYY